MDYQLGPGPLQVDQNTIDEKIKGDIGIVENGDVATHVIPSGYYVIWKGDLYVAKTDISSGTTLSAASNGNLTAKSNGLGAEVAMLNSKIPFFQAHATYTYSSGSVTDWNIAIEQWIDSLGTSNMMQIGTVQISGSGVRMVIVQKFNANYVSAIGFGYWTANVTYYRKVDGVWSFSILAQKSEVDTLNSNLAKLIGNNYVGGVNTLDEMKTLFNNALSYVPEHGSTVLAVSIGSQASIDKFHNGQMYTMYISKASNNYAYALCTTNAYPPIMFQKNSTEYSTHEIAYTSST